jgi:hypothetical protein
MFLVHIHTDIFSASHKRVFLSGGVRAEHLKPYSKGAPFLYCVGLPEKLLIVPISMEGGTYQDYLS